MIVWAPLGNVIVKVLSGSPVIENPLGTGAPEQDRFGPQVILPSGLTTTVPGAHGMGDDRSKGQIALFGNGDAVGRPGGREPPGRDPGDEPRKEYETGKRIRNECRLF